MALIDTDQMTQDSAGVSGRREAILTRLRETGWVRIADLAKALGVSNHTVRRDLDTLERRKLVKRIRGGAVLSDGHPKPTPVKEAIGKKAASLVTVGETVCIDAGSTTFQVARFLPDGIDVLTNAIDIAHELAKRSRNIGVNLTGGSLLAGGRLRDGLSGPFTLEVIRRSGPISKAIIGTAGVSLESGLTDRYHYLAEVKREMIQAAHTVILACESGKLGTRFLEPVCALSEIDIVVTDDDITEEQARAFEAAGVNVVLA